MEANSHIQARLNPLSYLLMTGHICVDMVQGGIAAVIPFLVFQNGFDYVMATMLVFAANIASAVVQPLFGWLGDRAARPWLMAAGVALAGLGMAGIGLFPGYWMVVASALLSGIGNAMMHPEGGRLAYLVGADRKAESMSVFSVGGQIGFCIGPLITVAAVTAFGLSGMVVYLIACIPVACILLAFNGRFCAYGTGAQDSGETARDSDCWGAFALVLGSCSVRSIVFYGVTSFVPLLLVSAFAASESFASSMITLFAAVGALATLASGKVSKKIATPWLMLACFLGLVVALVAFTLSESLVLSIILLMLLSVCLNLSNPAAVTLGQTFLPQHLGMASGLTFGVAVAIGGVASPLMGLVGDTIGLSPVLWILVGIAVAGIAVTLPLALRGE